MTCEIRRKAPHPLVGVDALIDPNQNIPAHLRDDVLNRPLRVLLGFSEEPGDCHTSVATLVRNDNVSFGSLRQSKRPEARRFGAGLE